jgi:LPS-assembly lipoprotein
MWFVRTGLLVATLLITGACGFRPLYAPTANGDVIRGLANIRIFSIRDRIGQNLHNQLLDLINPTGPPARPDYVLRIRLSESKESLAVRKSAFATRANLRINAEFKLSAVKNGVEETSKPVFFGNSASVSSYNILDNPFATVMAEKNARQLAVRSIAQDLRTRLAVFIAQRQK